MRMGIIYTLVLGMALLLSTGVKAADAEKKKMALGGGIAGIILKHADELGLTADQKAKLEEMAKGPLSVLTDEQKAKVKELIKVGRQEPKPAKKAEDEKKPDAKPEEKKDEKKPDEVKAEEKKPDAKPEETK